MRIRAIACSLVAGAALVAAGTSTAQAAPCPSSVPGYPTSLSITDGAQLCEAPVVKYGRTTMSYQVKWNGTWHTKRSFGAFEDTDTPDPYDLSLRVLRRVAGTGTVQQGNTDNFSGSSDRSRPVIVWLHGGGFTTGTRDHLLPYAKQFAKQGFVSVLANYAHVPLEDFATNLGNQGTTLTVDSISQEAQRNVQGAVRYLRLKASDLGINPNRIYVVGASAGGATAARMALRSHDVGSDLATRDLQGQSGVSSSTIRGAIPISAFECYNGRPNSQTLYFFWVKSGCAVDTNPSGDAPVGFLHGAQDNAIDAQKAINACRDYPTCIGVTQYPMYPSNELNNPTITHGDGSIGLCKPQPDTFEHQPGGDHYFADPGSCPARAGILDTGAAAPGLYANMNNARATVAMQIFKAVTHPTWQ